MSSPSPRLPRSPDQASTEATGTAFPNPTGDKGPQPTYTVDWARDYLARKQLSSLGVLRFAPTVFQKSVFCALPSKAVGGNSHDQCAQEAARLARERYLQDWKDGTSIMQLSVPPDSNAIQDELARFRASELRAEQHSPFTPDLALAHFQLLLMRGADNRMRSGDAAQRLSNETSMLLAARLLLDRGFQANATPRMTPTQKVLARAAGYWLAAHTHLNRLTQNAPNWASDVGSLEAGPNILALKHWNMLELAVIQFMHVRKYLRTCSGGDALDVEVDHELVRRLGTQHGASALEWTNVAFGAMNAKRLGFPQLAPPVARPTTQTGTSRVPPVQVTGTATLSPAASLSHFHASASSWESFEPASPTPSAQSAQSARFPAGRRAYIPPHSPARHIPRPLRTHGRPPWMPPAWRLLLLQLHWDSHVALGCLLMRRGWRAVCEDVAPECTRKAGVPAWRSAAHVWLTLAVWLDPESTSRAFSIPVKGLVAQRRPTIATAVAQQRAPAHGLNFAVLLARARLAHDLALASAPQSPMTKHPTT